MKKISIIIVNYKSREYLDECMTSIFNNFGDLGFEIIIINNDRAHILPKADEVRLGLEMANDEKVKIIEVGKNNGFGTSCNIGAKKSSGDILLLLNPDTKVLSNNVEKLLDEFKKDKNIGIIGSNILEEDEFIQKWSAGKELNIMEIIKNNLGLSKNKKILKNKEQREVDWVTGAAMFIRRDLFLEMGGFDEMFFLYFEDIDLCKRVRESGKKVILFPEFKIKHFGGKSSKDKKKQKREYYKSQDYYFEKWFGKKTKRLLRFLRKFHF